ncbi:unnamed protein product [Rotaria sordida]|uniref:Uncharacterized protein n=1 Tax=Rotaria sordida TaxID=392033 RepID=A0A815UCK4_9BILA|nr:unnamed protein product [Rotaria sordida]CAF1515799.1 unnamed protein product [Rotaria sordida]
MSDKLMFLSELETLLNDSQINNDERWEKFLFILRKYDLINQLHIQSVRDFDEVHNKLLDLLVSNNDNNSPAIDYSTFKKLESLIFDLRKTIESFVITNCIMRERLNNNETETNSLKEAVRDLQEITYEANFKKLAYAISTPLKNELLEHFRLARIRVDPLDEELLVALLDGNYRAARISEDTYNDIVLIYQKIAQVTGIFNYKELVKIIVCRQARSVDQHEIIDHYINQCKRSHMKPNFLDLLKDLNLNSLAKYKLEEMQTLEKLFTFYSEHGEYR